MSDFPIFMFLTPESSAIVALLAVLFLACYLIYLGISGMIKKQSILWSILKLFGGLLICTMFSGGLFLLIRKQK